MSVARRGSTSSGLALAGTMLIHGTVGALLLGTRPEERTPPPPTYRVRLVAAPESDPGERRAPEAVDRPAEQVAPATQRAPKTTAARTPPPPPPDAQRREAAPRTTPQTAPLPGERPSTGADVATVSTAGVEFPFPEYLQNVVGQVLRRWQRPLHASPLEAEVSFLVHRDGSLSSLQFVQRSGNFAFDLEARGAVEEAGGLRAFGPLPAEWPDDVLFVRFYFSGTRR